MVKRVCQWGPAVSVCILKGRWFSGQANFLRSYFSSLRAVVGNTLHESWVGEDSTETSQTHCCEAIPVARFIDDSFYLQCSIYIWIVC